MALVTCKDCSKEFSTDAKRCPNCGAKKRRKASFIEKVGFVLLGSIVIWSLLSQPNSPSSSTNAQITASTPRLELEGFTCGGSYGYSEIQGRVKNISNEAIDNLQAVAEFNDQNGNFVKSDNALIEYRPLLPGQSSPFKVLTSHNPAIKKCFVSFKDFGGREIDYQAKEGVFKK